MATDTSGLSMDNNITDHGDTDVGQHVDPASGESKGRAQRSTRNNKPARYLDGADLTKEEKRKHSKAEHDDDAKIELKQPEVSRANEKILVIKKVDSQNNDVKSGAKRMTRRTYKQKQTTVKRAVQKYLPSARNNMNDELSARANKFEKKAKESQVFQMMSSLPNVTEAQLHENTGDEDAHQNNMVGHENEEEKIDQYDDNFMQDPSEFENIEIQLPKVAEKKLEETKNVEVEMLDKPNNSQIGKAAKLKSIDDHGKISEYEILKSFRNKAYKAKTLKAVVGHAAVGFVTPERVFSNVQYDTDTGNIRKILRILIKKTDDITKVPVLTIVRKGENTKYSQPKKKKQNAVEKGQALTSKKKRQRVQTIQIPEGASHQNPESRKKYFLKKVDDNDFLDATIAAHFKDFRFKQKQKNTKQKNVRNASHQEAELSDLDTDTSF